MRVYQKRMGRGKDGSLSIDDCGLLLKLFEKKSHQYFLYDKESWAIANLLNQNL